MIFSKEALYRHKLSELHFKRESMAMDGNNTTTPEVSKKTSQKSPIKVSISSMTDVEPKSSKNVSKHNTKVSNSCSSCNANVPKGQLISKCPFGVIVSTKIPTKKFDNFCPRI